MSNKQSCLDWHETTGSPDWRKKVSMLADTDMPSNIPAGQHEDMSDGEREIFITALRNTRERQNGEYPGLR